MPDLITLVLNFALSVEYFMKLWPVQGHGVIYYSGPDSAVSTKDPGPFG